MHEKCIVVHLLLIVSGKSILATIGVPVVVVVQHWYERRLSACTLLSVVYFVSPLAAEIAGYLHDAARVCLRMCESGCGVMQCEGSALFQVTHSRTLSPFLSVSFCHSFSP